MIYNKNQIIEFLLKIDEQLVNNAEIHIIGGAASAIAYNSKEATQDVDTWKSEKNIQEALSLSNESIHT